MTRICILLICYYATGVIQVCEGQDSRVTDSLLSVIKAAKEDSNKVKTLNALSRNYTSLGEFDNSKKHAEDAIILADKIKFHKGKINANNNIGIVHYTPDFLDALPNDSEYLTIKASSYLPLWFYSQLVLSRQLS